MASTSFAFLPVRGTEENINGLPNQDGCLYFAYDSGNIYLDKDSHRYLMGGSSSGFFWCSGNDSTIVKASSDDADTTYYISFSVLEDNNAIPKANALLLNSDGRFFRVVDVNIVDEKITANLIAVSGTGGGGSGGGTPVSSRDLNLEWNATISRGATYIAGKKQYVIFTPTTSAPGDTTCDLQFKLFSNTEELIDSFSVYGVKSGSQYKFDTSWLPIGTGLKLQVIVTSAHSEYNGGAGYTREFLDLKVVEMGVKKDPTSIYLPIVQPDTLTRSLNVKYYPIADENLALTQHVYVDDAEVISLRKSLLASNYGKSNTVQIPGQSHGVHNITIKVSSYINGEELYSEGITYQGAWAVSGEETPIIWVGNYDEVIINYETSYIEFMVYDPLAAINSAPANVILYKENVEIGQMDVPYSNNGFIKWDISTIYEVGDNNYSIACRSAKVDVYNYVTTEGSRDLGLEDEEALMMNFSTAGRSNNEVLSQRVIFTDKKNNIPAILSGFNWKNNGWNADGIDKNGIDNGSYLNIANGAQVTLPFQAITLNSNSDYTIEMRYRIKNVQKYSTLVKTYAKYYINVGTAQAPEKSSRSYTMNEIRQMEETEQRTIELFYDQYGSPVMDDKVTKEWEKVDGVVCKWMQGNNGLAIGTQEAYFASPRGVVSVRYKEDEIINISIVISKNDNLCYIYLNGILSGADSLPPPDSDGAFSINSNFVINSEYCDIDLFRFRIYQGGLSMPQVIHNYLSDIHSIVLYDQNQLTSEPTKLSYTKLIQYNETHPEALTMPYATWKIISDNKKGDWQEMLPYYKGNKCTCEVTFVNPALDKALEDGLIDEWYYYTHCPSYRAVGVDIDVQGTSSQGYPRRNYKTKFKSAAPSDKHPEYGWFYTKGSLAGKRVDKGGSVIQTKNSKGEDLSAPVQRTVGKKFHMDNENIGTNKFTWKIDYMESSGTYNTGYANLMGNLQHPLYTQHPLDFYNISGIDTEGMRTSVYGFPVLTFHEYANANMNPSEPGVKYEYIGRYNINLDKSSNEYYGFEIEKEQPFIDAPWIEYETVTVTDENGNPELDGDGNEVTEKRIKAEHAHPWISQIAECWELSDNQGKWCSFKYPDGNARQTGFRTLQSGYDDRLECMLHFEYRYSAYGDQLDAIGADGNYDGSSTEREKFKDEIGTTHFEMSEYAYDKYKNLEAVFNWLDSTDQDNATNTSLTTPLNIQTPKPYNGEGEVSEAVIGYNVASEYDSTKIYYIKNENDEYVETDDFAVDESGHIIGFKDNVTYYLRQILYYNTTFSKDSAGYRLEKFRREFDQHLNKEYCLVYYIMTELLLCYDSRGKNMMFASFGPKEVGGDYIWFPIFYDIDTQLGLNNSGAYLWDYDADVSKDGLFSTPTSVLWVNLWDAFEEEIKGKYRVLRGLDDKSNVVGSLSYENIAGAYTCDSNVFDSYAMKGIRPTIAIGLDEYYKYFATTTASGVGYFNTDGDLVKEDSPTFAYACQGDKILTTELLLRNRLNYIDSWWMGGDYDIKKVKGGQLQLRVSGNRATLTSDKFLNTIPSGVTGFEQKNFVTDTNDPQYGADVYDAHPGYKLKPFLKQYISYFTDEVPGEPKKYSAGEGEEDGVWTNVPESTLSAYMSTPETPNEQLNYIPGLDYLSSLGDLSTSYISEFILRRGKRLLDLILGSDAPGYKNEMISSNTIFNLSMSKNDTGYKPLMKKVVFTGLSSLDKTIDISGSAKLQEFRALDTRIPNVYFADGAPIHTLHLPSTLKGLKLIQNNELTKILTSRPDVWNAQSPDEYKGLYVEGLTDATTMGSGHTIESLIVEGGGLGYDAYKLLEKYILVKTIAVNENDPNAGDKVRIGMLNQAWTPYEQVENGENYNSNIQYYKLNDHNMFDEWTFTTEANWIEETLNGTLYIRNADKWNQRSTITDLSMFEKFLRAYDAAVSGGTESKWGMKDPTSVASVPTITGTIYIDNSEDNLIDEATLTSIYKVRWQDLKITAAHINPANLSKYVRTYEGGRQEVITIERTSGLTPILPSGTPPTQTNYDFKGWSLSDPLKVENPEIILRFNSSYTSVAEMYETTEAWNNLTFGPGTDMFTFYAVFVPHPYQMTYCFKDGSIIEVVDSPYSAEKGSIQQPSTIPMMDESNLPIDRTYAFLGYSENADSDELVDFSTRTSSKNLKFYAVFAERDVYENIASTDYFTFNLINGGYEDYVGEDKIDDSYDVPGPTCSIAVKPGIKLTGKITLPAKGIVKINGINQELWVTEIAQEGFKVLNNQITHIFFEPGNKYRVIGQSAFHTEANNDSSALVHVDYAKTDIRVIRSFAFNRCTSLTSVKMPPHLIDLYAQAFTACFDKRLDSPVIEIGSEIIRIGLYAFSNIFAGNNTTFHIGSAQKGAPLDLSIGTVGTDISNVFRINQAGSVSRYGVINGIYFWSSRYYSTEDTLGSIQIGGRLFEDVTVGSNFYIPNTEAWENHTAIQVIHVD